MNFQIDCNKMDSFIKEKDDMTTYISWESQASRSLDFVVNISSEVLASLDFSKDGKTSRSLQFLEVCSNKTSDLSSTDFFNASQHSSNKNITMEGLSPGITKNHNALPWHDINYFNPEDCDLFFTSFKKYLGAIHYYHQIIDQKYKEKQLQDLFMNGTYDYLSDDNYIKCIAIEKEVEELVEKYVKNIKTVQKVIKNVSTETNISNALHLVETILLDFYGDFVEIGILNITYYQPLREPCQWINKIIKDDGRKNIYHF